MADGCIIVSLFCIALQRGNNFLLQLPALHSITHCGIYFSHAFFKSDIGNCCIGLPVIVQRLFKFAFCCGNPCKPGKRIGIPGPVIQ